MWPDLRRKGCPDARSGLPTGPERLRSLAAANPSDYRGRVTAPALYRRLHVDLARTSASLCRRA
ncbi:putative leader peptide [Actinacidiphila oryziradicis]|uniref:putative leader peptide n=1 Tax=Actinacidiphila oryziradicis TaxID=2571141 RepID=UPI003898E4B3